MTDAQKFTVIQDGLLLVKEGKVTPKEFIKIVESLFILEKKHHDQ